MVYQIYYKNRNNVLFDIEYWLDEIEEDCAYIGDWVVELRCHPFISGVIDFIKDKTLEKVQHNILANNTAGEFFGHNPFYIDFEAFKKDCEEMEELRGWIWEKHNNRPRDKEDAEKDCKEWGEYVREKIYEFAKKYDLKVNED